MRYTKHLIRFVTRFDCREHIGKIWNKSDRAQKLSDISTIRRARNFVIEIRINTTLSKICNSLNTLNTRDARTTLISNTFRRNQFLLCCYWFLNYNVAILKYMKTCMYWEKSLVEMLVGRMFVNWYELWDTNIYFTFADVRDKLQLRIIRWNFYKCNI